MRIILAALIVVALSGCASLDGALANRLACTADGRSVIVASMYGPVGVASVIDAGDAAAVLAGGCGRAR